MKPVTCLKKSLLTCTQNTHSQTHMQARANRGILYVDEVNLLDDGLVDVVLDSSASGINTVEREGISIVHPARFIMIGSGNPAVGVFCCVVRAYFEVNAFLCVCVCINSACAISHVTKHSNKGAENNHVASSSSSVCTQEGELRPQLLDRFGMSVQVG